MQPGIFVEMLTLEMGMCGGLSSGSAGQLLLPGGLGEGFRETRPALSLVQGFRQLRTALPPGQEHKLSWDGGVPGVFGGWLTAELGDSGVIRQWKGGLGPEVPTEKPC